MKRRIYNAKKFIENAMKVHGDKYDYSKVDCHNATDKVGIICQTHGEFWQQANIHLGGCGCPLCANEKIRIKLRDGKDKFIEKARKTHGDKYDYSKVEYKNANAKVCIICPIHGEFWQMPGSHLQGHDCPRCAKEKTRMKLSNGKDKFIEKAKKVHGDKYDYSKVDYKNNRTKVCIICQTHGEFWQTPDCHAQGQGCPKCANLAKSLKARKMVDEFIADSKKFHGNKYDYSKVEYINDSTKVCIICPEHGEFWQTPNMHLRGRGCPTCGILKRTEAITKTLENFVNESKLIHGDKYDYSKVVYVNVETKVCIICTEHGEFWQTPHAHLSGQGCPLCKESKLEKEISDFLEKNKITAIRQYRADYLDKLSLDFYLPEYRIAIECQGIQHFEPIEYFGGVKRFEEIQERDGLKKQLCEEHGVKMLYYSQLGIDYPYHVFEDKKDLLNAILETKR